MKLPALVQHFIEHTTENPMMTFTSFLKQHYLNSNLKDADYEKDMKLPFKAIDNFGFSINVIFEHPSQLEFSTIENCNKFFNISPVHFTNFLSFSYLNSIWQPPQFC